MARTVLLPASLFIVSAVLSVLSLYAAWASLIVGLGLCAYAFARKRRALTSMPGISIQGGLVASPSMRAGLALATAPLLTVVLVLAAMSGLFGRH